MIAIIDLRQATTNGLLSGRKAGDTKAHSQYCTSMPTAVEILVNDTDLVSSSYFVGIISAFTSAKACRLIGGSERTQDEYQRAIRRIKGLSHGQYRYSSETWYHL